MEAFEHIIANVFGRATDSPLRKALLAAGIEEIYDLISIEDNAIDSLTYDRSNTERNVSIPSGDKTLIRIFLAFFQHRNASGTPIDDTWSSLTRDEFSQFRVQSWAMRTTTAPAPMATAPSTSPQLTTPSPKYTKAELFKRGIKRDPSLFPTLKDERYNDVWHRSFLTQARAQDVAEVLNPSYSPTSAEDMELFDEKKMYVYSVLESKVLTDQGKNIVRQHEIDYDAQAVYKKLLTHHLVSTKAAMTSSDILSYITSAHLGNGEWRGTAESFIINWQNQVRLYERQVVARDRFSDTQKRIMLENAVNPIKELRNVKITADLERAKNGTVITFEQYLTLLTSAATAYDAQFSAKSDKKRLVYAHELLDYEGTDDDMTYDIDAPVSLIQAHVHDGRPSTGNRVRMSRERWLQLSNDAKTIWDQLEDKDKAIILGNSGQASSTHPPGTNYKPSLRQQSQSRAPSTSSFRRINLHEMSAYDFLQANLHEVGSEDEQSDNTFHDATMGDLETNGGTDTTLLVNAAKTGKHLPPGDIRRILSSTGTKSQSSTLEANIHVTYSVSNHRTSSQKSLVDHGANGGIAGNDVCVIHRTDRQVDIQGIDNHQLTDVAIGTIGGVVTTQKGPVIAVMHQYALFGKGNTIHAPGQLEWYKCNVNDKSIHCQGLQRIQTPDGYAIPLNIVNGLARMDIRPFTDHEWDSLPHVFLTSDLDWDPTVLDHSHDSEQWYDAVSELEDESSTNLFDAFGNYRHRVTVQLSESINRHDHFSNGSDLGLDLDNTIDKCVYHAHSSKILPFLDALEHETSHENDEDRIVSPPPRLVNKKCPDYQALRPFFGWLSTDVIKDTFEHTTQYARITTGTLLKRVFKSANPALNVHRRNEPVAADIVYADTPAVDNGSTAAVLFVGTESLVTDTYGIKTDKQFVNTLEDNIREQGAPHKLISN